MNQPKKFSKSLTLITMVGLAVVLAIAKPLGKHFAN